MIFSDPNESHSNIRKKFWIERFNAADGHHFEKMTEIRANLADEALAAFDKRFKSPAQIYQENREKMQKKLHDKINENK